MERRRFIYNFSKWLFVFVLLIQSHSFSQCPTCGNGVADAGETNVNCPQDVPKSATCTSPCSQPIPYESTVGVRDAFDFIGTTTFGGASLPAGWSFAGAPTPTTAGALPAADTYGAKGGLVQPNCSGSCTSTNGFCIGNIANSVVVGAGGTGGKLGANFDGRTNINQNLSYAVLRGQNNPTLVSPTYNFSSVEGFKIQFWLNASESSCGQTNGWGSCVGNAAYLDFSSNSGTSWTQILTMNTSSTSSDMCFNNSSNTFWIQEGTWSRVCLTVYKSTTSPGNFYPAASATTAPSGMMVNSAYFTSGFKFRIRYAQTASCTSGITTTNPGRYLAIDYPVITSGNQMIPCGISFINMCGYGADNNDDGVGSSSASTTVVFGTTRRSTNQAERGVEILTSQNATFGSQNLSGGTFATDYDLCNAEGGDKQCINWQSTNGFYTVVYEALMDFERPNINLQYYKGTTASSTTLTKVTNVGETPTIGWRYSGNRFVSCGSLSDLNSGCNGYSFSTPSLPTQFIRAFYNLVTNSTGNAWSFYGPTSCSHYFNGPFFSPISVPQFVSGETDFIVCNPDPVFSGAVSYCSDGSGFSGAASITITGPSGFNETIASNGTGVTPITEEGEYIITPNVPTTPVQCLDCSKPICITVTAADLISCSILPVSFLNINVEKFGALNKIYWSTASETNNDYFSIEKSLDAIDFFEIGKIDGAGISNSLINYSFTDEQPNEGTVYYRIKQTDLDGKSSFTKIISINSSQSSTRIIPNPNNGIFTIQNDVEEATYIICDAVGKPLQKFSVLETKSIRLDLSHLHPGIYFLLEEGLHYTTSHKILIQR